MLSSSKGKGQGTTTSKGPSTTLSVYDAPNVQKETLSAYMKECAQQLKAIVKKVKTDKTNLSFTWPTGCRCDLDKEFPTVRKVFFDHRRDCRKFAEDLGAAREAELKGDANAYSEHRAQRATVRVLLDRMAGEIAGAMRDVRCAYHTVDLTVGFCRDQKDLLICACESSLACQRCASLADAEPVSAALRRRRHFWRCKRPAFLLRFGQTVEQLAPLVAFFRRSCPETTFHLIVTFL
ncbi:hypothetical protein AK812_SmicGene10745 [Symbiodinium microadriaticum]|uniref:Uncharacterized protein n=1 Tax=Symbiodinium microadriaticum TaxID=2951 RepID=A0A1Q9EF18_SYMMI|nr:hypothetical protein AK812_SmicGene10745 [Symbiodinium microadriaticum]CAE7484676.1 unnamed protein product [Symbiodinium microadriaticum]